MSRQVWGTDRAEWQAAFAPHVQEIAVSRFCATNESGILRIACGHDGPPATNNGERDDPIYSVALSMSPQGAVALMKLLARSVQIAPAPEPTSPPSDVDETVNSGGGGDGGRE